MFVSMPRARPPQEVRAVLDLKASGLLDREIAVLTGVPVNTIRKWRNHWLPLRTARRLRLVPACPDCGYEPHDFASLPHDTYAYLLGVYLGDGHVRRTGGSWHFRIVLDAIYPGIISACCDAIETLRDGHRPKPRPNRRGQRCVYIDSTWTSWGCLFPQHGPGRKHRREIALVDWQREIVDAAPGPFLRGLIHTDGWRGINRVHVKGKDYAYPRYQFSNRSDDIRRLFTDACDRLGVRWRPWTRYHVSVAQAASVAILDSWIGPKW
jgi:hypothetical protein